jgi:hypothetical protein
LTPSSIFEPSHAEGILAFRLIPREEKFYEDFQALGDELKTGARLLEAMLEPEHPVWSKADEINVVEHKCDSLTHAIIQRLNRTFVTPLDREDIHTLARSLDDVMDSIDASATLIRIRLDNVRFARETRPNHHRVRGRGSAGARVDEQGADGARGRDQSPRERSRSYSSTGGDSVVRRRTRPDHRDEVEGNLDFREKPTGAGGERA